MPRQGWDGAVEWIRTTDLLITNQLLYQLSYNSPRSAGGSWLLLLGMPANAVSS